MSKHGVRTEEKVTKVKVEEQKRLGVVFDIDGTLIGESMRDLYRGIRIRPGAIDFIRWLKSRGHRVSLWTKASSWWADRVAFEICPLVHGPHECAGSQCGSTFDFVWSDDKLRRQSEPSNRWQTMSMNCTTSTGNECKWCEVYSSTCHQCECTWNYACPCREVKDLRKIWCSNDEDTNGFTKERTVIVEDTPQNCIYNYGNALYVPTYRGCLSGDDADIFSKMKVFFETSLEICENVRFVQKCQHGSHYHACYQQSWMI
mmetsp:Transcript_20013/g.43667  ORF Transcript_20013/g.43667 Transcript_20013/m.43667 type:complete len:259 (+) Transcript_20013:157-933(+)